MLQKKYKEKYNEGCLKIFKLLQLLYEDKAEYDAVMAIFSGSEPDADKQHVTLNKFLNTLKVFGMKIQKTNKRFETQNLPFSLKFDIDDLKTINLFENIIKDLPTGKSKATLEEFIKFIKSRFDEQTQKHFNQIKTDDNTDYSFYYTNLREQIELCESLCQVNYKIFIKYMDEGHQINTICNAKQMIYDNKKAYLQIFRLSEQELVNVPLTDIVSIEQLPTKKIDSEVAKTVVFKLQGRLAKVYKLRDGEYINQYLEDGSIVVVNKIEPINTLLKRLMRYDYDCVIIQPKNLKHKMAEKINNTLKHYE